LLVRRNFSEGGKSSLEVEQNSLRGKDFFKYTPPVITFYTGTIYES